jgi:hypothetical protein
LIALFIGVLKKFGKPEFTKEFFRRCIFAEDMQMMGFLSVASMAGTTHFIMFIPILMYGWLTCCKIS